MVELDRFEMRLQAAVQRYLEDAPVEADGASVARRVARERPRRWLLPDLRPLRLTPALAWLLFAALLALAGILALTAGSRLADRSLPAVIAPAVAACPAGSTPDEPGRIDQDRPPVGASITAVFDRRAGVMVAFAWADSASESVAWLFDVCTNTWSRPASPAASTGAPGWLRHAVYDEAADLTVALDGDGRVWVYDLGRNSWTAGRLVPAVLGWARLVYDPVSAHVLALSVPESDGYATQELWDYEVESDSWTKVVQSGSLPSGTNADAVILAYDASLDRIIAVGMPAVRRDVSQFDPRTGRWTRSAVSPPAFRVGWSASGGELAYDEAGGRVVVAVEGMVSAYDAAADRWEALGPGTSDPAWSGPLKRRGNWTVYDPRNKRVVLVGGSVDGVYTDDVWAFDPLTGEPVELLGAAREGWHDDAAVTVEGVVPWIERPVESRAP